jgi:PST family polysaccharide transporter
MDKYRIGAIASVSENIVKMISQMIAIILISRVLGPTDLGTLMYCLSISTLFVFLTNFGLDILLVNLLKDNALKKRSYLLHTILIKLFFGVIATFIVNLLGFWLVDNSDLLVLLTLSLIHLFTPFLSLGTFFQSEGKSYFTAISLITGHLIGLALKAYIILKSGDLVLLALTYVLEIVASIILIFYFYKKFNTKKQEKERLLFSFSRIKNIVNRALPLVLSSALIMVYMKIDQIMLGSMINETEVGFYAAATRLSEAWYFLGITLISVYYPKILELGKSYGGDRFILEMTSFGRKIIFAALLLGLGTTLLSGWIINLLYGLAFEKSSLVLSISIWAVPFVFINAIITRVLIRNKMEKSVFLRSLSGVIVNIALNFILIPKYGAVGAAISTVISLFISSYFINFVLRDPSGDIRKVNFGLVALSYKQ